MLSDIGREATTRFRFGVIRAAQNEGVVSRIHIAAIVAVFALVAALTYCSLTSNE